MAAWSRKDTRPSIQMNGWLPSFRPFPTQRFEAMSCQEEIVLHQIPALRQSTEADFKTTTMTTITTTGDGTVWLPTTENGSLSDMKLFCANLQVHLGRNFGRVRSKGVRSGRSRGTPHGPMLESPFVWSPENQWSLPFGRFVTP